MNNFAKMRNLSYAAIDYLYALRVQVGPFALTAQQRYPARERPKGHVILIPGIYERWQALKKLGDTLYAEGYQIHTIAALNRNYPASSEGAAKLRHYLVEHNLRDVVVIGHSKGGLVGLDYLLDFNHDGRIKKLIAVATPFSGSYIGRWIPLKAVRAMLPGSPTLRTLKDYAVPNADIISIYPEYDNYVWHPNSGHLAGARNVRIPTRGHHKILFDPHLFELVRNELKQEQGDIEIL